MNRSLRVTIAALGLAICVQAEDFNYTTNDGTITITGYTGPGGAAVIPSEIHGLPVTSLGNRAFAWCVNLSNLTIPNTVTNIGDYAFWECTNLTGLLIPKSVTHVGDFAFLRCSSLTAIGVEMDNLEYSSVDGVLFNKTKNTLIGYPGGKTGSYSIPQGVTNIWTDAFGGCSSLSGVTIPNSVTSIGDWGFSGCTGLTSVTIPNSVTSIGGGAFSGCTSLTSVTIPNSVTSIEGYAFSSCTSLTSVTIPNSVTSIEGYAFSSCTSLTSVTIPNSVTSIGDGAFSDCTSLTAITVDTNNLAYSSADGILFNKSQTRLIQYPRGKAGSYTIPNSVTNIVDCAFSGCSSLTSVTIPNSVTSIGGGAFEGCSSLTSLTIPNSVTSIGDGAFAGCSSLTNVIIPEPKPQPPAHPLVEEMLQGIQPANLYSMMRQITGEEPVLVGNEAVVFTNRVTGSALLRKATQFAFEQLQALGLQMEYQPWERAWMSGPTYSDRNIIAIQPGVSRPEEIVVICAHFDDCSDTDRAPGADDNGSGSAAVLTAARICSRYLFERTIHYVLFTGEEQHGLGSQEYVAQAVAGGSNIVAVLAPDMIGYASSALEPPTCSLWTWYVPYFGLEGSVGSELAAMFTLGFEVEALFTNVVAVYGLSNTLSCSFAHPIMWGVPSDAEFFFENGYPTLLPTHAHENPRYHTSADTLDTLNFSYFTAMVQAIVGTAAHLAYPISGQPPGRPLLGPVVLLPTGAVQVTLTGVAGRTYSIQSSSDLTNWLSLTNVSLTAPSGQFVDSAASGFAQGFYRAVIP